MKKGSPLIYDKHFVLSGTRDEKIERVIKKHGGYLLDGYSKKVDIVIIIAKKISKITGKL